MKKARKLLQFNLSFLTRKTRGKCFYPSPLLSICRYDNSLPSMRERGDKIPVGTHGTPTKWYTYEIKLRRYKITWLIIVNHPSSRNSVYNPRYVTYVQNSDNASRNSLISWVTQEINEFRRENLSIYASQKPSYLRWFTFVFNVLTGQGKTQIQPSNKSTKETTLNLLSGCQLRCCRQK